MAGSQGTLGFITEVTYRVATLPERCVAMTAAGSLAACHTAAMIINKSNLHPVFIAATLNGNAGSNTISTNYKLHVGFEGFSKPIDDLLQKTEDLLVLEGLKPVEAISYEPMHGVFNDYFKAFDNRPFILRADFPTVRLLEILGEFTKELSKADLFADFGCGRILVGTDDLDKAFWDRITRLSVQLKGHVLLEKAPYGVIANLNLFGPPRPEWKLTDDIKAMLDPHNTFTTDRLPRS